MAIIALFRRAGTHQVETFPFAGIYRRYYLKMPQNSPQLGTDMRKRVRSVKREKVTFYIGDKKYEAEKPLVDYVMDLWQRAYSISTRLDDDDRMFNGMLQIDQPLMVKPKKRKRKVK